MAEPAAFSTRTAAQLSFALLFALRRSRLANRVQITGSFLGRLPFQCLGSRLEFVGPQAELLSSRPGPRGTHQFPAAIGKVSQQHWVHAFKPCPL
jgi:hypothetical protein